MLNECKVVNVFGLPGLGKSSLVKNVSNYLAERNYYEDGILYINFQQENTLTEAIVTILRSLENSKDPYMELYN